MRIWYCLPYYDADSFLPGPSLHDAEYYFLGIVGLTSVGSIIGGCFFSIDGTVKVLETIAKVLPHYWLMKVGQGQFLLIYIVIMIVLNFVTYEKLNNGGKIG